MSDMLQLSCQKNILTCINVCVLSVPYPLSVHFYHSILYGLELGFVAVNDSSADMIVL